MSKISNNNKSIDKESKSSQIIIISKDRLSSAKMNLNYMTVQEGDFKFKIKMKNEMLNKNNINQTIESIKENILKHSRSYGKLENTKNFLDEKSKNQKKNPKKEKENEKNSPKTKKIKIKSILEIETTKNLNVKTTENNNEDTDKEDEDYNNNENEINLKNNDIISDNAHNDNDIVNYANNIIDNDNTIEVNDDDENNENNDSSDNNNEASKNRKIISQNFINNIIDANKKLKIPIKKLKSEEVKLVNKNDINENEDEKRIAEKKNKQSEKTTRSILGSILEHRNIDNINNLITENGSEDQSVREEIRSKEDLLSENKNKKIDENEDEDDEYEEVGDENEFEEKNNNENFKNRNINNLKIKSNNFNTINNNNYNNKENENEDFQKINNVIKKTSLTLDQKKANYITIQNNNIYNTYKMCQICEHTYTLAKFFVAECNVHYICKRCTKNYYEELIEDGIKDIFCPFINCKAKIIIDKLKNIISQEHYKRLNNIKNNNYMDIDKNNFIFTRLKTNFDMEKIDLYTKKHVIDINSNKNFYEYNREKEGYCPFCYEKALFTKTNTHFYKCLNCLSKVCRYCFKEFNERHINININYSEHCKVYYRLDEEPKNNIILNKLFMQFFFVFATFYLTFAGSFYFFKNIFFTMFNAYKKRNIIKYFIGYFFTIIFFVISFPFIFLLLPYFPSILSLSDY